MLLFLTDYGHTYNVHELRKSGQVSRKGVIRLLQPHGIVELHTAEGLLNQLVVGRMEDLHRD
jgi:hypothetical protein